MQIHQSWATQHISVSTVRLRDSHNCVFLPRRLPLWLQYSLFRGGQCRHADGNKSDMLSQVRGMLPEPDWTPHTDFTLCTISGYSCQTETSGWPWYYDHACTQAPSSGEIWTYTSSTSGGWYTGTSMGGKGANAYGVAIRWQSTDFQATPTFASSTATTASQPADNTLSSTPDSSNHGASSSASRGQLVGIGVGSSCGVLVLLALGTLLYCVVRRRRAKPAHNAEGPVMWRISPNEGSPSELQATEPAKEMYAPVRQLPPVELPAGEPEITEISNVRGDRYA
ncbi:hypothetical protein HFD88_005391 [Aspergillus terreus]|nr:hypothetical protein HFD88_005391 [Aspergillus terreus]